METRFKDGFYGSNESKNIPTAKGGAADGHVLLPKCFQYSDKNVREYEQLYRREVDALNIRKRNKGTSLVEYVDKVREFQNVQKKSKQVLKDPVINKMTVFKKLQKPNRPISRDFSFPHYKQIYTENNDTNIIPDNPGLRIGREITTVLDYTDFNPCAAAYQTKKLSVSENELIKTYLLPSFTQTWPFLSSPNAMMNGYPFGIFEPPPSHLTKNKALNLKAAKAIIHTSAKPRELNFSRPQWRAVLDVPYNTMDLMQPSPCATETIVGNSPELGGKSDRNNDNRSKILFARGGGFICRIPANDHMQTDNNNEE